MKKIDIKKATADDANFLATAIVKSSRAGKKIGLFDLFFKTNNNDELVEIIQKLVTSDIKNYCHYSNFLIATIDGKNVGTLCSYEPRIATTDLLIKALEQLGVDEENEYFSMLTLCGFEKDKKTWMLDFLTEEDGIDGFNIMKELLKKSLLTASLKGYRIVHTTVEIGSNDMLMLYKKLGFKVIDEKKCEMFQENFGRSGILLLEFHL